jgi:hypothetical protein
MPEPFDPYHRWLGISRKDQPPNHYRLLGIDLFEASPDVIEGAADQRMAHLKRFNTGSHSDLAERLLNEVAAARLCLLNPAKRASYDQALRQQLAARAEPAANEAKAKTKLPWGAVLAVAAGLAAVLLIAVLRMPKEKGGAHGLRAQRDETTATKANLPPAAREPGPRPTKEQSAPRVVKREPIAPPAPPLPAPSAAKPPKTEPAKTKPAGESNHAAAALAKAVVAPSAKKTEIPPQEKPKAVVPPKSDKPKKEEKAVAVRPPPRPQRPRRRLPVPSGEAVQHDLDIIRSTSRLDWTKANTTAAKRALAKKLVAQSRVYEADCNLVGYYAILQQAHQLAVAAGDAAVAFETADELARYFDIDPLDMKTAAVDKMLKAAKTAKQRAAVVQQGCAVLEEAAVKDEFEVVGQLRQQLRVEARKTHDNELIKSVAALATRNKELAAAFQQFQEAWVTLKSSPDDADANLTVGKYLCLTKGQWERGLPYLAKGSDKELRATARMETPAPPTAGNDQVNLADAWWDLGQLRRGPQRTQLLRHAAAWYEKAHEAVQGGLLRTKIEKRLDEIADLEAAASFDPAPRRNRLSKRLYPPVVTKNDITFDLGGDARLVVVRIPAGEFLMGDEKGLDREKPVHKVRITKPFYLGKYDVTQEQWQAVTGDNPSRHKGPKYPVERVTWDDCQVFLQKLTADYAGGKGRFTLPTEAQWEYACRAGSTTRFFFGDDENRLGEYAWYAANAGNKVHPVGQKRPNAWGLHDMQGNVWQWCQDWYDDHYYAKSPADDPRGPSSGQYRVVRGGWWMYPGNGLRSGSRGGTAPDVRSPGLRVCLIPAYK